MSLLSGQALNKMTKALMAPLGPFQLLLDAPNMTHVHCLQQAYDVLERDGKEDVIDYFRPYDDWLKKGLLWADKGWKNVCHYFLDPKKSGGLHWPGADGDCQYYFNKAVVTCQKNMHKGMFFIGASLHLVQDMCVPHHAVGTVFDGHQEFEKWAGKNLHCFTNTLNGVYKPFTHPSQWIKYNAEVAASYYPFVSQENGCNEQSYFEAAGKLLPLTVCTTAGFLSFSKLILQMNPLKCIPSSTGPKVNSVF